ncbi:MAG: hypothetical protein A2847_02150 [Candidatus Sungbacteria bacterium RIFCSPHIGHO2_01_FULL_50_25]|uniref:Uncharacterized protein n=1 Tax=Candidatus Sungbacteria bacterium RIFCSPHIGHO2_01_FULL_50_25 TaxID=1802265 RepID=A0A1G2K6A8_9BACT|nr:MAG: hypothetical protein A2847_02150 [Candidatus Sungbacteria bacterium RIFCSPHIGHO2_01_FULL_50_25]
MYTFYVYEKIRKKERDIARRMQKLLRVLQRIVEGLRHGAEKKIDVKRRRGFRRRFFLSQIMIQYVI